MKISGLWITKNEAKNITGSIASVAGAADELVVVDTGSTDDTVALAEQAGAKVVHFDWVDDFSAARNFALEQVDGDIVIFMDADERFEPVLGEKHREWLLKEFGASVNMFANVVRANVHEAMGTLISKDKAQRIMRGKGTVRYMGVIHERPTLQGGETRYAITMPGVELIHNGYAGEVVVGKLSRNIRLLAKALEAAPDDVERTLNTYYLMRESTGLGLDAQAWMALKWLLGHGNLLREFMITFPTLANTLMFTGVEIAAKHRAEASRLQVKTVIVDQARAVSAKQPGSQTADLHYACLFAPDEGRLLAEIEPAIARAQKLMGDAEQEDYFRGNVRLYTAAGNAAWRRGKRELAFEYATKAVQQSEVVVTAEAVALLLKCVKGLPVEDIIAFLNSVLKVEKRGILDILVSTTQFEGYGELYAYYIKKQMDAGWAKKSDFWLLMIVLGKAAQAAEAAEQAEIAGPDTSVVTRTWFLAVACSQDEALYARYRDRLGAHVLLLDAFFGGWQEVGMDFSIIHANYQIIAFAAGRQVANRLLACYADADDDAFMLMATYYNSAGLYAEFLSECPYFPGGQPKVGRLQLANCQFHVGNYSPALELLRQVYVEDGPDDTWFSICDAIAACAPEQLAGQAREMSAAARPGYEQWVDRTDVANTGVVIGADSKQQRRALQQMTAEALEKRAAPAAGGDAPWWRQPFAGQVEAALPAGAIYAEKKVYHEAAECAFMALGHGQDPAAAWGLLARVFEAVGNGPLAQLAAERGPAGE